MLVSLLPSYHEQINRSPCIYLSDTEPTFHSRGHYTIFHMIISLENGMNPPVLANINMKTPSTATREINPDSATRVRPMVSPRVKQTMLVPRELPAKASSSAVQILPFNMTASDILFSRWVSALVSEFGWVYGPQMRINWIRQIRKYP